MILLIDIGNTRVKWRILDATLLQVKSGEVINANLSLEYVTGFFGGLGLTHIYISNVADDSMVSCFESFANEEKIELKCFKSQSNLLNVKLKYEDISRMGVDRGLALLGAYDGEAVMVIDAGSAITADYLNDNGEYLGGYIIPGLEMSRNLLINNTAKVGVLADSGSGQPGLSTAECVNNGVVVMFRSLIEGLIKVAEGQGVERFVVTGGDAVHFQRWGDGRLEFSQNLVLDGMEKYHLSESGMLEGRG